MVDIRLAENQDGAAVDTGTTAADARRAGGTLGRGLQPGDTRVDATALTGERLRAFVEGVALGAYRWSEATSVPSSPATVRLCGAEDGDALERGLRSAAATAWARDLANTRSDVKTPAWLAERAAQMLAPLGVTVTSHGVDWLTEHGFGGVLAVGGGSAAPPVLIRAGWQPPDGPDDRHVVLVGKGITFDTGGINRKPGNAMTTMYTDMAGGAAVLGALHALAAARVPMRVTVLVPAAENSLSGSAYRPGDVVRHVGGRTSEIGNTDAEGRLVLADALAHAAATLQPSELVDVATLTGAAKVALGLRTAGLFATADPLADALLAAADAVNEPLWRLPMPADYEQALHSDIADATNAPGPPGAITAALFLRPFAGSVPWAHVDIAGPARAGKDDGYLARGATGFGVRLLERYVESIAAR